MSRSGFTWLRTYLLQISLLGLITSSLGACSLTGSLADSLGSLRDVAAAAEGAPGYLRLQRHIEARMSQRFLVAPDTHIRIDNPQDAQPEVLQAAYAGLAQVYPRSSDAPVARDTIRVRIVWPQWSGSKAYGSIMQGPVAQESNSTEVAAWGVSLLGTTRVPGVSAITSIPIIVSDAQGKVITQADVQIRPRAWDAGWPKPELVMATFVEFAQQLRDG